MGAALCFLLLSLWTGSDLEAKRGQTGIRFTGEVLSADSIEAFYEEAKEESLPELTLWKQTDGIPVSCESSDRDISLKVVTIWGNVEAVYPDCLAAGSPLIKEDSIGCMLSEEAAYELFGGWDVLGKTVYCEGKTYTVRGILKGQEAILVRENKETSFTCAEAVGTPGDGKEKLRQILLGTGALLENGAVIETDTLCGILRLFRLIPELWLAISLYRKGKERAGRCKPLLWLFRLILLAVIGVLIRNCWCFSEDFIPSRWSDFSFFSDLWKGQKENLRRYGDIAEVYKDRMMFSYWKRSLLWIAASIVSQASLQRFPVSHPQDRDRSASGPD